MVIALYAQLVYPWPMNYRHIYHAGNFADVMKHCVLLSLVHAMQRKDKPFFYLDTHAGIGCYDLQAAAAQKLCEHSSGINRLLAEQAAPPIIAQYLSQVKELTLKKPHHYPGSPYLVRQNLRSQDRMAVCELHPQDAQVLKTFFQHDKQVAVHQQDGYQGLKAFLPPLEKRGLILIDPSFEHIDEFKLLFNHTTTALDRFAQGVYCLWYPIKDLAWVQRFKRQLQTLTVANILCSELAIAEPNPALSLAGSGLIIINTPWKLEHEIAESLEWLWSRLNLRGQGFHRVDWLIKPT